jgi:superfamily I DNA and RNA helicase
MKNTWWVGKEQLDGEQKPIIELPIDGHYLVVGPPGSGKTNLLLLRANYLTLAGYPNIAVVVFTRALREWIAAGAEQYQFRPDKIVTLIGWEYDLLRQYGERLSFGGSFLEQRSRGLAAIQELIERRGLEDIYDAILLDESQDYLPAEIDVLHRLAKRLFAVADSRQKIYDGDDPLDVLEKIAGNPHRLRFHYRNGLSICRFADGLAKDSAKYEALAATSNYDEKATPSSVEVSKHKTIQSQADEIISKLTIQIKAYPEELLGVVCPRNEEVQAIWSCIAKSPLAQRAVLHLGDEHPSFDADKQICVTSIHGMKGLEVRALHIAGVDGLKKFASQRNVIYTAATRAKTSLSIYHIDGLPGYIEKAIACLTPLPKLPTIDAAFGRKSR